MQRNVTGAEDRSHCVYLVGEIDMRERQKSAHKLGKEDSVASSWARGREGPLF